MKLGVRAIDLLMANGKNASNWDRAELICSLLFPLWMRDSSWSIWSSKLFKRGIGFLILLFMPCLVVFWIIAALGGPKWQHTVVRNISRSCRYMYIKFGILCIVYSNTIWLKRYIHIIFVVTTQPDLWALNVLKFVVSVNNYTSGILFNRTCFNERVSK